MKINKENKLEKLVRLMKRYQSELQIMEGNIQIVLESDGTGSINKDHDGDDVMLIFNFNTTNELMEFLEASQLERTIRVRSRYEC